MTLLVSLYFFTLLIANVNYTNCIVESCIIKGDFVLGIKMGIGGEVLKKYLEFWQQAFNFTGETTRYTYWYQQLINGMIGMTILNITMVIVLFSQYLATIRILMVVGVGVVVLFSLLSIVPGLALDVRRLRNAGLPWLLIFLKVFNTLFDVLMLFPANKAKPRLERKERFYWLGSLSIIISLGGLVAIFIDQPIWFAGMLISLGLALGIFDLVLNLRRRRMLVLVSLSVAMFSGMVLLAMSTVNKFNQVYEHSTTVTEVDRTIYDVLNMDNMHEGKPVSALDVINVGQEMDVEGVSFKVISTKVINDDYIRIALDIENTSTEAISLGGLEFELAGDETMTRMIPYDAIASELDLDDYNFRLIDDQDVEPEETLKGTLTFEASMKDAKYLVVSELGEREVALSLA